MRIFRQNSVEKLGLQNFPGRVIEILRPVDSVGEVIDGVGESLIDEMQAQEEPMVIVWSNCPMVQDDIVEGMKGCEELDDQLLAAFSELIIELVVAEEDSSHEVELHLLKGELSIQIRKLSNVSTWR